MGINFNIGTLLLGIALVLVAWFAYRRTTPAISPPLRWVLTGLRTAAFVLLALLIMDPRYIYQSQKSEPAGVIALIDQSASMSLPAMGWDPESGARRFDRAKELTAQLRSLVESRGGRYVEAYFADDLYATEADSTEPNGQGTDLTRILGAAHKQHEGENITGIVLLTDGVDTEEKLVRDALPPTPVFAVGFGDTSSPEDVRIKDVDYNSIVRAPSRTHVRATLSYSGDTSRPVRLRLLEGRRVIFEGDTLLTAGDREVTKDIPVEFVEEGRRNFVLEATVDGTDVELDNNRRDIVIEAEKAGVRVLIVDWLPSWEMHFLTDFMRQDETFDFDLVSSIAGQSSVPADKLKSPDELKDALDDYDAIVLASVDNSVIDDAAARAIVEFVREKGKGLLVLPGASSLFEQPTVWGRLSGLLPVSGRPPHRFQLQFTSVRPGAQAGTNPITSQLVPLLSQLDWQQRSPLLGYYTPLSAKNGVEVLLETDGQHLPAFTYQAAGNGRVAVLSVGPLWRWKFLAESNTLYDEMISRMLDVLSRGEDTERFALLSRKNVYDSGEAVLFTAEVFNEKMQPVTGVPVRIEITRVEDDGTEVPLDIMSMQREGSDNTRFKASLSTLPPGHYRVTGEAQLPGRSIRSQPLDISVSDVSVEFQNVSQDRGNLERIARQTGGTYVAADNIAELERQLDFKPRIVEITSEMSFRTSLIIFLIMLTLLGVEWTIRKRAGMI